MLLHHASGPQEPRPGSRPTSVTGKTRGPAPRCWDAGPVAMNGLRVRRSQRRSDGRRRLRRTEVVAGTAWAAVEVGPLAVVPAAGAHGVVLRPVVMASVVPMVAGNLEAGEEDGHGDEQDPGDDHNPRREPVEPIRFNRHGRWLGGDGGRPGWDFRCFTHT
jgi:hypothetical protein